MLACCCCATTAPFAALSTMYDGRSAAAEGEAVDGGACATLYALVQSVVSVLGQAALLLTLCTSQVGSSTRLLPATPCVCRVSLCVCGEGVLGLVRDATAVTTVVFGSGWRLSPPSRCQYTHLVLCTLQLHCDPMLHATCCCRSRRSAQTVWVYACGVVCWASLGAVTVNFLAVAVYDGQLRATFAHTCSALCRGGKACGPLLLAGRVNG